MKAALYIRVSTEEQAKEGNSIEAQREKLVHYAKAKELDIARIYIDEGISGATIEERKALLQQLDDAKNGMFEAVLIYKLDRLGRNARDLLDIKNRFKDLKVELISLTENIDTTTPTGNAMYGMISVFAELEKDTINSRMTMGREQKVKKGIKSKTGKILYGYDYVDGRYVANEQQAAIVRMIYDRVIAGDSIRSIARYLTEHKVARYNGNTYWSPATVRRLIINPTYKGYTFASLFKHHFNKYFDFEGAILEKANNVEPIVQEEIYNLANNIIESRKGNNTRKYAKSDFYFADVAYCASCGWKLYARNATEKSGSNRRRRYYRCQYNNSHFAEHKTCSFTSMENTSLEKLFLEYLENLELNLSAVDEMESSQQSDVEKAEAVMNELISRKERLRGRRDKLLEKYLDGIIDDETYMTIAAVIDDELAEIEDRIQNLEAEIHPREKINYSLESLNSHLQQSHSSIREMWALLSNDEKRMFVTTLVKKMYIAKGRIVSIIFN